MRRYGWVLVLAGLLGAWEAWVDLRSVPDYLLPSPSGIVSTLWSQRSLLVSEAGVTFREMILGFLAAMVAGLAAATLLQRLPVVRRAVYPLLVALQTVPVVAVSPLLVINLGFGLSPKILIVALMCFFPVTVNALDGFTAAPADMRRAMLTLNASPRAIFWRVQLPWAAPRVFSGARIAATYTAVGALFAELAGGSGGLEDSMRNQLDTQLVGAAIFMLALLALALFGAVTLLERVALPWSREG